MNVYTIDSKLLTAVTSRFATLTTAITQNHMTIVRPCDRSNLNTSDSEGETPPFGTQYSGGGGVRPYAVRKGPVRSTQQFR